MKKPMLILSLVLLSGCARDVADALRGPQLSPVGDGLRASSYPVPTTPPVRTPVSYHSTWDDGTDLYAIPAPDAQGISSQW
jgi:flagellar L-ring protein precursor FlgH